MRRSFCRAGRRSDSGRGEEIYPLVDLPRHWIVIVRPPFGVSTVEAYAWYDEDRAAGVREPRGELQILPVPWPTRAAQMINDLEPPVLRRHPEIGAIKAALREAGAVRRGDVGQRLGGFRPVPDTSRRRPRRPPPGEDGARGLPQPHADAGRAREARPSDPAPRLTPPVRPG